MHMYLYVISFYFGHLSDVLKRRKDTGNDLIPLYEFHYQW